MYCDYFGFREKPFNITPDPGFIYLSDHHREAFAHLLYAIDNHVGFATLSGEVGSGKTTVVRTLLSQLDREKYRTALILNPSLSSRGLMQSINREFGLPGEEADGAGLLLELNRFLLAENAAGRTVVLVIDEAQDLEPPVLEQVRLISNLETERDKLIQIVLVGQPELREILRRQELRQLAQRIGVSFHLQPMAFADTGDYIYHRLEVAGRRDSTLFTAGAVRRIFRFSGGLPRLINLACDRALLLGYTREKTPITAAMAAVVIADLRHAEKGRAFVSRRLVPPLLVLCASLLLAGGWHLLPRKGAVGQAAPASSAPPAPAPAAGALRELGAVSETTSAVRAFDALSGLWHLPSSPKPPRNGVTPESFFRQRGLECYRFSGSLGALLRLDTPALLELTVPGVSGRRYLALTGTEGGRVVVSPPLAGRTALPPAELEGLWSGRALLPWRNYLDIPAGLKAGARGETVGRLQGLLRGAGAYPGPINGRIDPATLAAVRQFQAARGIEGDGTVGRQTLFHLYRSGGGPAPKLAHPEGHP